MQKRMSTFARVSATLATVGALGWLIGIELTARALILVPGFIGLALAAWAARVNPAGARVGPSPVPAVPVIHGPYRFVRHPMYVGQGAAVTSFMWYAAGFWAAFAIALVTEILFREFVWREEGAQTPSPTRPVSEPLACNSESV